MQGKTINGFELIRFFGVAGMAEVWYAENENYKPVIVRILDEDSSKNAKIVDHFPELAELMVKKGHQVYGSGLIDNRPAIIIEYDRNRYGAIWRDEKSFDEIKKDEILFDEDTDEWIIKDVILFDEDTDEWNMFDASFFPEAFDINADAYGCPNELDLSNIDPSDGFLVYDSEFQYFVIDEDSADADKSKDSTK